MKELSSLRRERGANKRNEWRGKADREHESSVGVS